MATSTSTMLPSTQNFYTKKALDSLKPRVMFLQHCQVEQALPSNSGRTVTFYRNTKLSAATTPLTEGTTPAGSNVSRVAYTTTPSQYGDFTVITDLVASTDVDSQVVSSIQDIVAEQAARTIDVVCRSEFVNFSQVVNAGRGINVTTIVANDIRKAARDLRAADVLTFTNDKFRAILHPSVVYDLKADTNTGGWIDINKYDNSGILRSGDGTTGFVGSLDGVDIYETSLVDTVAVGPSTAYRNIVVGRNAFAAVKLDKNSLSVMTKGFESGGTEDPLEQRMTLGWKMYFACKSLDDNASGSKNLRSIVIRASASA